TRSPAGRRPPPFTRRSRPASANGRTFRRDGLTRFTTGVDPQTLREDLGARLADWQGLLERQPIQARQILRKPLHGRLIFEPFKDERGRGYHIRGQATYGRLLFGVCSVVPPG